MSKLNHVLLAYDAAAFTGHYTWVVCSLPIRVNDVYIWFCFLSHSTSPRSGRVIVCEYAPYMYLYTCGSIWYDHKWIGLATHLLVRIRTKILPQLFLCVWFHSYFSELQCKRQHRKHGCSLSSHAIGGQPPALCMSQFRPNTFQRFQAPRQETALCLLLACLFNRFRIR